VKGARSVSYRVYFKSPEGKTREILVAKALAKKYPAEDTRVKVRALAAAASSGAAVDSQTASWVATLHPVMAQKLANLRLITLDDGSLLKGITRRRTQAGLRDAVAEIAGGDLHAGLPPEPLRSLARVKVTMADPGIFLTPDGLTCVDLNYLNTEMPYKAMRPNLLTVQRVTSWILFGCTSLDPSANEGKLRAFLGVPNAGGEAVIIVVLEDIDQIVERAPADQETPEERRQRLKLVDFLPGSKWIGENTWHDAEWREDLLSDKLLSERLGRTTNFFGIRRKRTHLALSSPEHPRGRKPRSRRVPRLVRDSRLVHGRQIKGVVSSFKDFEKIVEWENERLKECKPPPEGWKTRKEIAQTANLFTRCDEANSEVTESCKLNRSDKKLLDGVLKKFKNDHPEAAAFLPKATGKNRYTMVWYFDPVALRSWVKERDLKEIADPLRPCKWRAPSRRLKKCVLAVQFILIHGFWNRRKFRKFIANPPTQPLLPSKDGVLDNDLRRWLTEEKGGFAPALYKQALSEAHVQHRHKVYQGPMYAYLEGPVTIEPLEDEPPTTPPVEDDILDSRQPVGGPTERTARRRGRPRRSDTKEVYAYCYKRWIKGDKLAAIRAGARTEFPDANTPEEDSNVTEYAQRHAERNHLPLNRPK
jgi:hypothetical protein